MNPIQTPRQDPDVDEQTGRDDPLDDLLTQIINGFFVLTDAQGAVSKWSEPAELLFGLDASEALGNGLFDTLVDHAPPEAEAWKRFLASGEAPRAAASQPVRAIHAIDRRSFPLELVFIPVKLDEGFDFSLFLEDLSFELPRNLMLTRMRRQHPVVVRALGHALETEAQPWNGGRTAGTLVAFRPTEPTPWVEEALAAREAARAAADALGEQRLDPDPGIHGDSVSDLDDAAAVVARLLTAVERIDDLERTAAEVPVVLEAALADVETRFAHARDAFEEREAALAAEVAATRRALFEEREGEEPGPASAVERVERLVIEAQAQLKALQSADARLEVRVEALNVTDDALDAIRERAAFADAAFEAMREEIAVSRRQAEAALQRAEAGDRRIERLSSELTVALATLDELQGGLTSAGDTADLARLEAENARQATVAESEKNRERVSQVFHEIIGLAARSGAGSGNVMRRAELGKLRAEFDGEPAPIPTRAPRHGFDDVSQPLAVLNLKGRFCELNPAFSKLVGYQEHEFMKAVWPSVHDRAVIAEQTDQLAAMAAGELEEVEIRSSFMHSQGLMVAVDGTLTLIRDDGGEPMSLLLTAKER